MLETPFFVGQSHLTYPIFQRFHREWTAIGVPFLSPGLHMRNYVVLSDYESLRARGIRYAVFHHYPGETVREAEDSLAADIPKWIDVFRRDFGPPCCEDDAITVFDLESESLPE